MAFSVHSHCASVRIIALLVLITLGLGLKTPAHAGFEWLPVDTTKQNEARDKARSDVQSKVRHKPKLTEMHSASKSWGEMATTQSPHQQSQMQTIKPNDQIPVETIPAQTQEAELPPSIQNTPKAEYTPIDTAQEHQPPAMFSDSIGFGSDIPLAFAVRKIIPSGFTHAFGKSINLGARISWTGDKAWNLVLQDAIAPLGLQASINGRDVFIHRRNLPSDNSGDAQNNIPQATAKPASLKTESLKDSDHAEPKTPKKITQQTTQQNVQFWQAYKGQNIRDILIQWAPQADVELQWQATGNYRLSENVLINDTFNNALIKMLNESTENNRVPVIQFQNNSNTLIIKDRTS